MQRGLFLCVLAALSPRTLTGKEVTKDDEQKDDGRISAKSARNRLGCTIDLSGHYVSDYTELKVVQKDCQLFVTPPGKVIGIVTGSTPTVAGQQGRIVGGHDNLQEEIIWSNSAIWTRTDPDGWTMTKLGAAVAEAEAASKSSASGASASTTVSALEATSKTSASVTSASTSTAASKSSASGTSASTSTASSGAVPSSTTFPWWAVGIAGGVAGVAAIAGGVAAGVEAAHNHEDGTASHANNHQTEASKSSKEADIRFMSRASIPGEAHSESAAAASPQQSAAQQLTQATGPAAMSSAVPTYVCLLGGLAFLCGALTLAGVAMAICRRGSSKGSRNLRITRADSQVSDAEAVDSEDETGGSPLLQVEADDV